MDSRAGGGSSEGAAVGGAPGGGGAAPSTGGARQHCLTTSCAVRDLPAVGGQHSKTVREETGEQSLQTRDHDDRDGQRCKLRLLLLKTLIPPALPIQPQTTPIHTATQHYKHR
jgi:hypothetical protein